MNDNQLALHTPIRDYFDRTSVANFAHVNVTCHEVGAGHGCCEMSRCWLVEDLRTLPGVER